MDKSPKPAGVRLGVHKGASDESDTGKIAKLEE
jgi:hypothetical protein